LRLNIGPPFKWDEERRLQLRCELDAIYAHLYGVTKEELNYILETFPIVKRKDEAKYGEYRTKRMILEYYEKYKENCGSEIVWDQVICKKLADLIENKKDLEKLLSIYHAGKPTNTRYTWEFNLHI